MLESTVSQSPIELNKTYQEYISLTNKEQEYRTKLEILFEELFKNIIE